MSIDINKNRDSILTAYNDVLDDKTDPDWILLGYEGPTNVLKLVSTGDGGLEELADDLNSGKIMYAVVRITDPKTTRTKNVLINWQGEGVQSLRKGTCARHIHDVRGLLKGIHVTINARTEQEVEMEEVLQALSKASSYNFNERSEQAERAKPVGTNYQRTNPLSEINTNSRNKFWEEQEKEESCRKEEDLKRKKEEQLQLEQERKKKEADSATHRAAAEQIRSDRITVDKKAMDSAEEKMRSKEESKDRVEENEKEEEERRKRSEVMRTDRKKEAESLIGHSTSSARSMFENMKVSSNSSEVSRPPPRKLKDFKPLNNNEDNNATPSQQSSEPRTTSNGTSTARVWPPPSNTLEKPSQVEKTEPRPMFSESAESSSKLGSIKNSGITASSTSPVVASDPSLGTRKDPIGGNSGLPYQSQTSDPAVASRPLPEVPVEASKSPNLYDDHYEPVEAPTAQIPVVPDDHIYEDADPLNKFIGGMMKGDEHRYDDVTPDRATYQNVEQTYEQPSIYQAPTEEEEVKSSVSVSQDQPPLQVESTPAIAMTYEVDGIEYQLLPEHGLCARALYDYQASDDTEISFDPSEIISNIEQIDEGWWQGVGPSGEFGLFPANYVELINAASSQR